MFKDESGEIVPAIVSEALWERANAVLRRRSEDVKARQGICNHDNLLTGKLFCTHCGTPYYRRESRDRTGSKNSKWVCSGKIKAGADSCPSFAIYEEELKPLLFDVFKETKADADAMVEEYVRMYQELSDHGELPKRIEEHRRTAELAQKKKAKLLEYNVTGQISDGDFLSMTAGCNREIQAAEEAIQELEEQIESIADCKKHIDGIRRTLKAAQDSAAQGLIGREFVERYIDKIYVTPEENGTLRLDVKIFTGESTARSLEKLKHHTGHTFKKMIEAYENGLK